MGWATDARAALHKQGPYGNKRCRVWTVAAALQKNTENWEYTENSTFFPTMGGDWGTWIVERNDHECRTARIKGKEHSPDFLENISDTSCNIVMRVNDAISHVIWWADSYRRRTRSVTVSCTEHWAERNQDTSKERTQTLLVSSYECCLFIVYYCLLLSVWHSQSIVYFYII